jgi:hypothetical protein
MWMEIGHCPGRNCTAIVAADAPAQAAEITRKLNRP